MKLRSVAFLFCCTITYCVIPRLGVCDTIPCDDAAWRYSPFQNVHVYDSARDQFELSIALNPFDPDMLLVAAITTERDYCGSSLGTNYIGQYTSVDGGLTWSGSDTLQNCLPGAADPTAAFGASDKLFVSYISMWLQTSNDTGMSWIDTINVAPQASGLKDKSHMVVDVQNNDHVFISWDRGQDSITFTYSFDGGNTFCDEFSISGSQTRVHGVNLAVNELGHVFAVWANGCNASNCYRIGFNYSLDSGVTWGTPQEIGGPKLSKILRTLNLKPPDGIRANGFPVISVDTSQGENHGTLYVVCAGQSTDYTYGTGTLADIFLMKSADAGTTWTAPLRVNDDTLGSQLYQFDPWMEVDPEGGVNIAWYDSRNSPTNELVELWMARSMDGGQTLENIRVSNVAFEPCPISYGQPPCPSPCPGSDSTSNGYIGSYIGITASKDFAYPTWMDNRDTDRLGSCGLYHVQVGIVPIHEKFSGPLGQDTTWYWLVGLSGDVTVDSTETLTIEPTAIIRATDGSDSEISGVDTTLVELIVYGTVILGVDSTSPDSRARFQSESGTEGSWYGIRIMPGGVVQWGNGCRISDAVNGVTVSTGVDSLIVRNVDIDNVENAGFLCESDDARFVNCTVKDIAQGYGIYLDDCDPSIDSCLFKDCEYGVYAYRSASTVQNSTISGGGAYGVYVSYASGDTLSVDNVEVSGYYTGAHLYAGGHTQIDDSRFLSGNAADSGSSSTYGIKAYTNAWIKMRNSQIVEWSMFGNGFYSYKSHADLGVGNHINGGDNAIHPFNSTAGGVRVRHQGSSGTDTLKAEGNWWGSDSVNSMWFTSLVDYDPWLSSDPFAKRSIPITEVASAWPTAYSLGQNYPNPFNPSTTVEFALGTPSKVKIAVYNILGQVVRVLADQEYPAGLHRVFWDGIDNRGRPVSSGVYLYRLVSNEFIESKKMVLLK